jgi:hypothetical protein
MVNGASATDSLQRTIAPTVVSTAATAVQACSTKKTRVIGWWSINFYFGDEEYWTED